MGQCAGLFICIVTARTQLASMRLAGMWPGGADGSRRLWAGCLSGVTAPPYVARPASLAPPRIAPAVRRPGGEGIA